MSLEILCHVLTQKNGNLIIKLYDIGPDTTSKEERYNVQMEGAFKGDAIILIDQKT